MRMRLGWFKRLGGGFGIGAIFGGGRSAPPAGPGPVKVPAWPLWCLYAAVVMTAGCVLLCIGGLVWNAVTGAP